jgi:hypothetical protein
MLPTVPPRCSSRLAPSARRCRSLTLRPPVCFLSAEQKAIVSPWPAPGCVASGRKPPPVGDTYADTVYVPVVGTDTQFPFLTTDDL